MKSDKELIARCLKSYRKAQKLLYEKFAPKMIHVCRRYSNDRNTAEDVMQEGFIKVFSKIDQLKDSCKLDVWVQVNDTSEVSPWGSHFWWDSDYHESSGDYSTHPLITTGKSDGWIQSRFNWQWYFAVKTDTIIYPPDSLMIRFTFISDTVTTNKEGWMIDDIVTASAEWQDCSAIKENASDIKISISPNPTSGIISIKFDNEQMVFHQLTVYDISGQIILQKESRYVDQIKINLTDHQPGIYFYLLKNKLNGEYSTGKIIRK